MPGHLITHHQFLGFVEFPGLTVLGGAGSLRRVACALSFSQAAIVAGRRCNQNENETKDRSQVPLRNYVTPGARPATATAAASGVSSERAAPETCSKACNTRSEVCPITHQHSLLTTLLSFEYIYDPLNAPTSNCSLVDCVCGLRLRIGAEGAILIGLNRLAYSCFQAKTLENALRHLLFEKPIKILHCVNRSTTSSPDSTVTDTLFFETTRVRVSPGAAVVVNVTLLTIPNAGFSVTIATCR